MTDYQKSQDLIISAEAALKEGDFHKARALYREAAVLQKSLVDALPTERVRTRSAFGMSAATLFYRANALPEAERLAHSLMAEEWLDDHSRRGLESLLARIWNEGTMVEGGLPPGARPLTIVLLKGKVGHGLAPLELVDTTMAIGTRYIRRIADWCNHEPFEPHLSRRLRDIAEGYRALVSEPAFGSYRISWYLTQDQLSLDLAEDRVASATPSRIVNNCIEFARLVEQGDQEGISDLVTDQRYRGALIRLVRQLLPDGETAGEVQIRRADDEKERAVRFLPEHRPYVSELARTVGTRCVAGPSAERSKRLTGVLRAIDLDKGRLRLQAEGVEYNIEISDVLYDIIGPMLNKRVVVQGRLPSSRMKTWIAEDIELEHRENNESEKTERA